MSRISRLIILVSAAITMQQIGAGRDVVEVRFDPALQEFCHVLRFPVGWQMPKFVVLDSGKQHLVPKYSLYDDYEFRAPGLLGTRFLVRGVDQQVKRTYTINVYEADLSDPKSVAQPASEEALNSAGT